MKNVLYLLGTIFLILLSIYVLKPVFNKNKLPDVEYYDLNNNQINFSKIKLKNKETFIFYVSPDCNYCKDINKILDTIPNNKYNRIIICENIKSINYWQYKKKFIISNNDVFLIDKKNNFIHDFNITYSYSLPLIIKFDINRKKSNFVY
jgi:hypothetical protein